MSESGQSSSAAEVVARAAEAYQALADLAETIEDEWQYVTDLVDTYLPSIQALGDEDLGRALPAETVAAVDEAIAEIALIADPHKAIDWLSTFPHVVALALGGDVDRPAAAGAGAGGQTDLDTAEPDDDSPVPNAAGRSMRFQDAAKDARAVVYAGIQADPLVASAAKLLEEATTAERLLARAAMNGERTDPETWRRIFPTLFGDGAGEGPRRHAEQVLAVSLEIASRGEAARSQYRGAVVEELTARLLARRAGPAEPVRRERRVLFDGVRAEIHPYDVTLESAARPEVYDCKWGARGINADVLNQLDDARAHAAEEDAELRVAIVVFDARRSCEIRLDRSTANHDLTRLVALESFDELKEGRS